MSAQLIDIEKIIAPLSTTNPCGESARYEPEYEALQAEIAKQESLNPEPVNWGQVIDDAKSILEAKSKDLLVASYLCYGLFERQGYEGLASGVQILLKFIQQFWEDLYPEKKRLRGRVAAASWLVDKLEKGFEQRKPGVADKDRLSEIQENFEQIRKAFDEHAGNDSPDFTPLWIY